MQNYLRIWPSEAHKFNTVQDLESALRSRGCGGCELSKHPEVRGCCVYRGNASSKYMIIGEAPGKDENITGKPFTGPAGQLLDKIWQSVGMDTNNWYITNVVHCRPVAEKGSGKENYTPLQTQIIKCAPYVNRQIALLDPKIIVTVGLVATQRILSREEAPSMLKVNGQVFQREVVQKSRIIFPILHPACILHSSGEQKDFYKREIWTAIQKLKGLIDDTSV